MMRLRGYVLWGVFWYLAFLIMAIPVGLVLQLVEPKQFLPVIWENPTGTIWSGRLERLRLNQFAAGPFSWLVRPSEFLLGRLALDFALGGVPGFNLKGTVQIHRFDEVTFQSVRGQFAIVEVLRLIKMGAVKVQGGVVFRIEEVVVTPKGIKKMRGEGTVSGLQMDDPWEIRGGSFTFHADTPSSEKTAVRVQLQDGPLQGKLNLWLGPEGRYRLRGVLLGKGGMDPRMANFLRQVGGLDANNRLVVNESGRMDPLW
ncbi:MAG: type II secretion system protein N [Magnetococcus sp. XQGC-1]